MSLALPSCPTPRGTHLFDGAGLLQRIACTGLIEAVVPISPGRCGGHPDDLASDPDGRRSLVEPDWYAKRVFRAQRLTFLRRDERLGTEVLKPHLQRAASQLDRSLEPIQTAAYQP